jgi:hypothetical protein
MSEEHDDRTEGEAGPPGSRYAAVTRRAFLARSAGFGVAAAFGLAACGHNDADVFARGAANDTPGAGSSAPKATTTTTARASTTPTTRGSSSTPTTSAPPTTSAGSASKLGDLAVHFTYAASGGRGRVNNPYVAVWIEDTSGTLVDTLGLWYLQNQKGRRYLNELRRWSSVDGDPVDTISSATRTPGDYALLWKLVDSDGKSVGAGDYVICIEAAREHGPYSLIQQTFTLGSAPFTSDLASQGELSRATITYPAS